MEKPKGEHVNFALAAFVAGSGVAGYVKRKSKPLLIAGLGFSAIFATSGVLISRGETTNGHILGAINSCSWVLAMTVKDIKSFRGGGKQLPSILSVIGGCAALYNYTEYTDIKPKDNPTNDE